MFFQEFIVSTNDGIIGENISNQTRKRIESIDNKFYTPKNESDLCLDKLRIFSSDQQQTYSRFYLNL